MSKFKFKVGDVVKVVDSGERYNFYQSFFSEQNVPIELAARYAYGNGFNGDLKNDDDKYVVLFAGNHRLGGNVYLISRYPGGNRGYVYMIAEPGITLFKEMETYAVPVVVQMVIAVKAEDRKDVPDIADKLISDALYKSDLENSAPVVTVDCKRITKN